MDDAQLCRLCWKMYSFRTDRELSHDPAAPPQWAKEKRRQKSLRAQLIESTEPPPKRLQKSADIEQLMERLNDALDSRAFTDVEQLLCEIQEAGRASTPSQKDLIKRAKQALSKESIRQAVRTQRHSARREKRWDPELNMEVNLDSMIDKYEARGDGRSRKELTAYYNTLKKQG